MKYDIDIIVQKISNKKWNKRGRWYHTVLFDEIFGEGESTSYAKKLGYPFKRSMGVWLANGDYLDLEDEWLSTNSIVADQYAKDHNFLQKYSDHCLKNSDELVEFSRKIQRMNVKKLSDAELGALYVSAIKKQKEFMPFMVSLHSVDCFLTEQFDALLNEFIKKEGLTRDDFFKYQTALTLPFRKILVLQEKIDLMELAITVKKGKLSLDDVSVAKQIQEHTEKYSWINAGLLEHLPYTPQYFTKRLGELMNSDVENEYDLIIQGEKDLKVEQIKCMKEISSYPELAKISKLVQIFGFLRSYRVDVVFIVFVMIFNVIEEIASRLNIAFLDMKYIDSGEINVALSDRKVFDYKKLISERAKGFVSVVIDDDRYELIGEDAEKVSKVVTLDDVAAADFVKGSTAYPGKVTAPCKVLFNLDDMKKVNKGDVIVISMTDPNYIPVMDKACAFVTDQGGILCHAAIVSREMKKPCIIGTKVATKLFKDGDILEVDGDKGIVKILSK